MSAVVAMDASLRCARVSEAGTVICYGEVADKASASASRDSQSGHFTRSDHGSCVSARWRRHGFLRTRCARRVSSSSPSNHQAYPGQTKDRACFESEPIYSADGKFGLVRREGEITVSIVKPRKSLRLSAQRVGVAQLTCAHAPAGRFPWISSGALEILDSQGTPEHRAPCRI